MKRPERVLPYLLTALAPVAVAMGIGLSVLTGGTVPQPHPAVPEIAWADLPGPAPVVQPALPSIPLAPGPTCSPSQLQLGGVSPTQLTQDYGVVIQLRNAGTSNCSVPPAVSMTLTGGGPLLRARPPAAQTLASPLVVPSGQSLQLWADNPPGEACDRTGNDSGLPVYDHAQVDLDGTAYQVGGLDLRVACQVSVRLEAPQAPARYRSDPLAGLRLSLFLPAAVRPGGVLSYSVLLSNPTRSAMRLGPPCVEYFQSASWASGSDGKGWYDLNCAGHTVLRPGSRLRFDMQIRLDPTIRSRLVYVNWTLGLLGYADTPRSFMGAVAVGR